MKLFADNVKVNLETCNQHDLLQRDRMARHADRCIARPFLSVRLSVCPSFRHVPVFCPEE